MKTSTRKRVLFVLIRAMALLWFADEYPTLRFRGDGHFSGGPIFGYSIRFRPIPFYEAGEYVFHFRGMPREEMILGLQAEGKNIGDEGELHAKTTIEAQLVNQKQTICQAGGQPLLHRQNPSGWVLMLSGDSASYWHWDCGWFQAQPSDSYTLTLRIRDVDPKTPRINLIPTFTGGQPDLP